MSKSRLFLYGRSRLTCRDEYPMLKWSTNISVYCQ
jgi:hypothetical protein